MRKITETGQEKKGTKAGFDPHGSNFLLEILRYEFSKRVQKNGRYSQRSFAKYLGVSHTLLSLVMNGKREPSRELVEKLSERLNYSPEKSALLLEALRERQARKKGIDTPIEVQANRVSLDQFALISEWQHYAILSLLEIPSTKFDPKPIAERLGISPLLAKVSMQRLVNLGIVAKNAKGEWKQRSGPILIDDPRTTDAGRKFQRQLLGRAVDSLMNDAAELRDFSSTTFAMNPKHIPYAITRIRDFRRQLMNELEAFGEPEEVYNLTVQIFPTSRRQPKRSSK